MLLLPIACGHNTFIRAAEGTTPPERSADVETPHETNSAGRPKAETAAFFMFMLAGLSIALGSILLSWRSVRLLWGLKSRGIVVSLRPSPGDHLAKNPVFQFRDSREQEFTVVSRISGRPPVFQVGDRVPVVYAAADPSDAEIATFRQLWAIPTGFFVVGFGLFAMGLCGRIFNRRYAHRLASQQRLEM